MTTFTILQQRLLGLALFLICGTALAQADPPGRVARLNHFDGSVTFAPAGTDDWAYAELNRPLTTGDRIWADQGARAELHAGSSALRLGSNTSLEILNLGDDITQLKLAQGTLNLRVRDLRPGQPFEIDTPNLAFVLHEPGEYRLDVAPDGSMTTVRVQRGSGRAYGDGNEYPIAAPQLVSFTGTGLIQIAATDYPPRDAFDDWAQQRDRIEDQSYAARYLPREVVGYEQLDSYGNWLDTNDYGPVWIPRNAAADWAPYRYGHWAWVAPWGWTWIDDAPWGFAPFHYGRWVQFENRWCWVPGRGIRHERPVYAPALVAFVGGGGSHSSWSLAFGSGSGVAWYPLGPGESWRPAYAASPRYVERINSTVIIQGGGNRYDNPYVNRHRHQAFTAVAPDAFVRGEPVDRHFHRVDREHINDARIVGGAPAIAPVQQSLFGAARFARTPAGVRAHERPAVATMTPPQPAAANDALAQSYARQGGQVPGAGAPLDARRRDWRERRGEPGRDAAGNTGAAIGTAAALPAVRVIDTRREHGNGGREAPVAGSPAMEAPDRAPRIQRYQPEPVNVRRDGSATQPDAARPNPVPGPFDRAQREAAPQAPAQAERRGFPARDGNDGNPPAGETWPRRYQPYGAGAAPAAQPQPQQGETPRGPTPYAPAPRADRPAPQPPDAAPNPFVRDGRRDRPANQPEAANPPAAAPQPAPAGVPQAPVRYQDSPRPASAQPERRVFPARDGNDGNTPGGENWPRRNQPFGGAAPAAQPQPQQGEAPHAPRPYAQPPVPREEPRASAPQGSPFARPQPQAAPEPMAAPRRDTFQPAARREPDAPARPERRHDEAPSPARQASPFAAPQYQAPAAQPAPRHEAAQAAPRREAPPPAQPERRQEQRDKQDRRGERQER
ncbi:MAG: hypothetical protein KF778_02610 [Rhodocyclaceae bacterium]|nr:hypothetical protein [Rhodocyclaceae bacterium]